MDLTATLWSMNKGIVTELKYKDQVFIIKPDNPNSKPDNLLVPVYTPPSKKTYTHGIKISYLEKWIKKGCFEVFTLEQFYQKFPKQRKNRKLEDNIRGLIDKKIISQLNNDGKFRVNRGKLK